MTSVSKLELRQLRQFVAVAEESHFRRAAGRLGMAQPPLSQAILKLEREIGVELLERTRRSVRLTEAGDVFLDEARRVLAGAKRAVVAAQRAARGQVGTVRLTYVGAASYDYLPRLLRAFRDRHPDVEVELRERTTAAQVVAVRRGEADVGLVRPPIFGADELRTETVLSEPLAVALPETHRLNHHERLRLADLAGEGFVMFPAHEGPSFHARVVGRAKRQGSRCGWFSCRFRCNPDGVSDVKSDGVLV